ncbi:Glycosyl transferases group 1 [Rubripirellula amarantea]|uniref:Glycosyl transferases group 1 n=1 Tax=Rubripirellula amarantea TaxID=2527999 RepID=A0A5C5WLN7_9BACT|nr:glycosyltransferase family 4 protein [Rubripirellula amarantea]TWT50692.1 Glycosyl transferases group 1 [Rubripirellula amarantea]
MTSDLGHERSPRQPVQQDEPFRGGSRLRVLMLGRRFWPLVGNDSANYLVKLATGLSRIGMHVEVVTPKSASSWTQQFQLHDIRVHRPVMTPKGDWTASRYTRQLTQWLRSQADSFDVIFADSIREEAIAAVEACRGKRCKVILRLGNECGLSDADWWKHNRASKRCEAIGRMADAIIVKSPKDQRALLGCQYDAKKIHRVAISFPAGNDYSANQRSQARQTLASVNSDLTTSPTTPVVLCHARMNTTSGIDQLVQAARLLISRDPDTRVWMIGDGPERDRIFTTLRGDGVRANIAMPGSFSSLDDVFAAGNLYVQTGNDGLDYFLPQAIAAELPIVAADIENIRNAVAPSAISEPNDSVTSLSDLIHWYDPAKESSLRKTIQLVMADMNEAAEKARRLRMGLLRWQPDSQALDQYAALIRSLVGSHRGNDASVAEKQTSVPTSQSSSGTGG